MNPTPHRKPILIAIIVVGVLITIGILASTVMSLSSGSSRATPTPTVAPKELSYDGITILLARGASTQHIENFKFSVYRYLKSVNQDPKKAVISNVKHVHDSNNTVAEDIITFNISFDDKSPIDARIEYNDRKVSKLILTDRSTNKPIYDSGPVAVSEPE